MPDSDRPERRAPSTPPDDGHSPTSDPEAADPEGHLNPPAEPEDPSQTPDAAEPEDEPADEDDSSGEDDDDLGASPDEGLPPAPDDGPLHVLPVRYLPLSEQGRPSSVTPLAGVDPSAGPAGRRPGARVWHWVPLGALIAMATTTLASMVVTRIYPETEVALRTVTEAAAAAANDDDRFQAMADTLEGPMGEAIQQVLVALLLAFVVAMLAAGFLVAWLGRTRPLEAALAAATFALLSSLFMGGGLSLLSLPTPGIAFLLGLLGGWLGWRLRRRRAG